MKNWQGSWQQHVFHWVRMAVAGVLLMALAWVLDGGTIL